jgi:hypothetical protein
MTKDQKSIAAGNDYGRHGNLKSLNGTTKNACTPVRLYNIDFQIQANHSTNHSIAFPITGLMECLKVLPYMDADHWPQVTFLGPQDEWRKVAGKYKYLYEMDAETANNWLQVWVGANHPSFEECTINTSDNVHLQMNCVTNKIVQETITTDEHIMRVSAIVDAEDEENAGGTSVDHKSATPYTIHTAVLPKLSLIDANVNSSINAMWKIQPEDTNTNNNDHFAEALPSYDHGSCRPAILVSCESNEPVVEWTDNTKLLSGAFPDKFLFGQGVPKRLPTEQNWKHFALYYDGQFYDPLLVAHDTINC